MPIVASYYSTNFPSTYLKSKELFPAFYPPIIITLKIYYYYFNLLFSELEFITSLIFFIYTNLIK
jgi:hypothetical protein